jgi:phenylacetate-CoA ligase
MAMSRALYTRFAAGFLFPVHERLKRHDTVAVRTSLEESQWWPPEKIAALQLDRLRAMLGHVDRHVPYYRSLFKRIGFKPAAVRSLADFARLPFLTKADIRESVDALKSDAARGLARFNTGGSSGEPLVFYIGRERVSHDVAAKWRATRWWGVDIGDPEIVVWGSPVELGAQDWMRALRDRMLRTELLPAFEISERNLDDFVARIRARRPRMLFGYPSAISLIAAHAEKRGTAMDDLGVKVAFVTAERLYDDQRARIERVFGCRVANGYGGRDAGFVAHACPEGGMHVTAEDIVVEAVDGEGRPLPAGEAGELVVTHLATGDFPFIRYRTGDIGILDDRRCPCGRGLPMLREIQGRTTDFVVAQDGTVMHGLALIYVLRDLHGIKAFRICQETVDRTDVLIVPDRGFDSRLIDAIQDGLKARLGPGVEVNVELVPQIRSEASGKFRYVVSRVERAALAGGVQ